LNHQDPQAQAETSPDQFSRLQTSLFFSAAVAIGPQLNQRTICSSRSVSSTRAPSTSSTNPTAGQTLRFIPLLDTD
jgi:hypothetical protein